MQLPVSLSFAATVVLLGGTLVLGGLAARRVPESLAQPLDRVPSRIAGWTSVRDQQLDEYTLHALDATSYLSRSYRKEGKELGLFVAFYAQQRAGESMHSPKHCLPGAGWEILHQDTALVPVEGQPIQVNEFTINNLADRMLMLYWYQSPHRIIANEYVAKLLLARDTLVTGRTSGSIVRILLPDVAGARQQGIEFASAVIPEITRCFGGGRPVAQGNEAKPVLALAR